MTLLIDHDGSFKGENDGAILIITRCLDLDDASIGTGFRFPHAQYLALGVDRVSLVNRGGDSDIIPAKVDAVLGDI